MKERCVPWKKFLAVALAAALLVTVVPKWIIPDVQAVTQAEIDALKQDADALAKEKADLEKQLKSIQADKNKAMEQKRLLEDQIDLIQREIQNIQGQIDKYDELIAAKQADLLQAQADEQAQFELFCRRVRFMEEQGNVDYWSILFSAADFTDLLDRLIMVDEFMAYDNAVMDNLVAMREQIEVDKASLEQSRAEQEQARQAQEAARTELQQREADVDKLIAKISQQEDQVEQAKKELDALAKEMDAEIAKKEKELAAQLAKVTSEAGYRWPLDNYRNLSSLCGGRIDPFTHKPATHSGIDIPAPKNTPIRAAKSGVVITSKYMSGGYGQYVVISHSANGDSTLYAHMVKGSQKVKVGDTVKQGDIIGYVGTTGRSTGYHLHFEIREGGTRIDPCIRFNGLTYKGKPQSEW